MVDPYDFIGSPTGNKSKRMRRKSIMKKKTTKKRKSNEKPRRDIDQQVNDIHDKENNSNHGFTQLIQTKMLEVKKRQGNRKNKKVAITVPNQQPSSSIRRKRRLPNQDDDNDNSDSDFVTVTNEREDRNIHPPVNTIDENVTTTIITTCHHRCESKDHHLVPANKRRRACLCSKRQLYELEFAPDSAPSQSQHVQEEEQQPPQEESHLEPLLTTVNQSPAPLLLPISSSTSVFVHPPIASVSIGQNEETNEKDLSENVVAVEEEEEDEKEIQLNVPSMMAAPLSPAMPLNSTYIAHRTNPVVITQARQSLLNLSTFISTNTTTISHQISPQLRSTSTFLQITNLEPNPSDEPTTEDTYPVRHDQETSMTQLLVPVQTIQCSVSTQTDTEYEPTHHHCSDVSVCPCVQTYTRSEQLFLASMAVFFRNSITVTPCDPSNIINRMNKKQQTSQRNRSAQSTPIANQIEHNNETYVVAKENPIIIENESEHQLPSPHPVDTSTVIHETRNNSTKKSDGSSIQINIHSDEELPSLSTDDRQKFQSLVLTMTALKDEQKIVFNRFVEHFSVRSSPIVDNTTTHLITDEEPENSRKCPLTGKVLQAVVRHLPIVSYRWLADCLTQRHYIDELPTYEIVGDAIYSQHHGMSRSRLTHSNNSRLLANYAFHLKCHSCQPFTDNRPLIELINLSGGIILKALNQHINNIGRQIVILCSKNYLQNKPALEQACQKFHILCIEPEWLIASIVKFEIQPYEPWLCTLYS